MTTMIYDRRKKVIGTITLSMIRSTVDLHATPNTTGEIMYQEEGCDFWIDFWTGPAAMAGDVFEWAVENLKNSVSIEEIEEYMMGNPAFE